MIILLISAATALNWEYKVEQTKMTWHYALKNCDTWGGSLVSIDDAYEQSEIVHLAHKNSPTRERQRFWIGLHDTTKEGQWEWADKSCGNYRNWDRFMPKNDPKNYHEDCAILHNTRADMPWHDLKCNTKLASICKKCADAECTSEVKQSYKC